MKRLVLPLALLAAAPAAAQQCPSSPGPQPCYTETCCDPSLNGNPVFMSRSFSFYRKRDFTVAAPGGELEFLRTFTSDPTVWGNWALIGPNQLTGVPVPFGNAPAVGSGSTIGGPLRWTHNLFSVLIHEPGGVFPGFHLRDLGGSPAQFSLCPASATCWAAPRPDSPSTYGNLKVTYAGGTPTSFQYTQPNGVVLVFDKQFQTSKNWFLRKALNLAREVWFEVVYFEGSNVPNCATVSPTPTGVPYIKEVRFNPDGGSLPSLQFNYAEVANLPGAKACLVSNIKHRSTAGVDTLASYSYYADGGVAALASVAFGDGSPAEQYSYGGSNELFRRDRGALVSQHNFPASPGHEGFAVTSASGAGQPNRGFNAGVGVRTATAGAPTGITPPCSNCTSGADGTTQFNQAYESEALVSALRPELTLTRLTDDLTSGWESSGSEGQQLWTYGGWNGGTMSPSVPGRLLRHQNKLLHVTDYGYQTKSVDGTTQIVQNSETRGIDAGAPTWTGLESWSYDTSFDPQLHPRRFSESRLSVANPGNWFERRRLYEAGTSRLAGVIEHGWTKSLAGSTVERYVGTFYLTSRGCSASGVDPSKRTLRVEGPCETSFGAAACTGTFPVTEFHYYGLDASDALKAGRLWKVVQYADGSACTGALTTEYTEYDAAGMPTKVLDPNNVETRSAYQDKQMTWRSVTVGGLDAGTSYAYDNGRLTLVTYPNQNVERYCYRTSSDSTCSTGTPTTVLQWKGKAPNAASAWTERVDYLADGTIVDFRNPTEVRRTETRYSDVHGRVTSEGAGMATVTRNGTTGLGPTVATKKAYDGANNVTRLGPAFNDAPDFCASNSTLCAWLTYDSAERLSGVDLHPAASGIPSAASTRTCFEYDGHGNVKRVSAGYTGTGTACPINNSAAGPPSNCSAFSTDYEHDDFGNVTAVTFPWTTEAAKATTRYEYNAAGAMVKKQTAEMRAAATPVLLEQTYDAMGRLLSLTRKNASGAPSPVVLWTLGYDNDETVASGCGAALTLSNGRLSLRTDAFGKTWYRYDEEGRVLAEVRLRIAYSSCTGNPDQDRTPSTFYSYDLNGNLKGLVYPHGRVVETVFDATDRPTSIRYNTWNGSAWSATWNSATGTWTSGTPTTLLSNITWEPYGGLRGYKLEAIGKWVDYYLGGSLETAPTYSGSPNDCNHLNVTYGGLDRSGRLRSLLVSNASSPNPVGDVFKQVYTWKADVLVRQDTCHKNNTGAVVTDTFGYDRMVRLTSAASNATPGAPTEGFSYDLRGNRTYSAQTGPTCTET